MADTDFQSNPHEHVTGREAADFYLSLSEHDRASVALGAKYVRFNPLREKITLEDVVPGSGPDMFALSLPRSVVEEMLKDRRLVSTISESMSVAIQLHPVEISEKVRLLREQANLPNILEADTSKGQYVGTVIAVGKSQTKTLVDGVGVVVHHNDNLSERPQANKRVKIAYEKGVGSVEHVKTQVRDVRKARERGDGGLER